MNQFSEDDVRAALEQYHTRIRGVIDRGFEEWLIVKEYRMEHRLPPVLYARTVANYVFDAIARHAIVEFGSDDTVRVKEETQTVKFCFGDVVIARFKKGDEDNLGQNIPTQAVLEYTCAQQMLPGFPPEAAKVEFIWSPNDLETEVEDVLVVARDGERVLWSYPIDAPADRSGVIEFPVRPDPDDDGDLVTPKPKDDQSAPESD